MKFTLTYDGPLPSSGNKGKNDAKWTIRKTFAPQLKDLWVTNPALQQVMDNRHFPKSGGAQLIQVHHKYPGPVVRPPQEPVPREFLDLCEPIPKHSAWFLPLVRESFALHCGLKIQFLRQEPPGKVYQGGDIDGRIKTLLDALTMPQHVEQVLEQNVRSNPIYCLLEDHFMVSGLQVESERLLTDQTQSADFAKLFIEVDMRVRQATIYNQSFLG